MLPSKLVWKFMDLPLIFTFFTVLVSTYCSKLTSNTAGSMAFCRMHTDVFSHRGWISEGLTTRRTRIWFIQRNWMCSFVSLQVMWMTERPLADFAGVKKFTGAASSMYSVASQMALHHLQIRVLSAANLAYVAVIVIIMSYEWFPVHILGGAGESTSDRVRSQTSIFVFFLFFHCCQSAVFCIPQ